MNCQGCGEPVESDGHGELVHESSMAYGCTPDTGKRFPRGNASYPVAS